MEAVKKNNENIMLRAFQFLKNRYAPRGARVYYSQAGEDILINSIVQKKGILKPLYIDIGAHHPYFGNNTYLFYKHDGTGVLIEPDPQLADLLQKKRPRDTVVAAGAGAHDTEIPFYLFPQNTRNTFSQEQAESWQKQSGQTPDTKQVRIMTLDTIINEYCDGKTPDIISIDAEGYDVEILSGFSWSVRPKVFCIETAESGETVPQRNTAIYELFEKHGYTKFAETPANMIFIDKNIQ